MNQAKKQKTEYRKWNVLEEVQILKYMKEQKDRGVEVEKPTASKYYTDLLAALNIPNASIIQIKNKVKNLKASYSSANQWANQTGQGVDKGTVEGYMRKLCQHYEALDEIYGDRVTFCLPFLRDTLESDNDEEPINNTQEHFASCSQITRPNETAVNVVEIDCHNIGNINAGATFSNNSVRAAGNNIIRSTDSANNILEIDRQNIRAANNYGSVGSAACSNTSVGVAGSNIIRPASNANNMIEIDWQNVITVPSSNISFGATPSSSIDVGDAASNTIRTNANARNIVDIDLQNVVVGAVGSNSVASIVDLDADSSNEIQNIVGQSQRTVATVTNNSRVVPGISTPNVSRNVSINKPSRRASIGEASHAVQVFLRDGGGDDEDETSDQQEKISRFKQGLSTKPKSSKGFCPKPKPMGSNAASVMSTVMSQKSEALTEKNKIEQKKAEDELYFKNQQLQINLEIIKEKAKIEKKRVEENSSLKKAKLDLNCEKFKHYREMEKSSMDLQVANIELKKAKMESKEKLAILELEKQERLEMFKMKLEFEKMKKGGQ